MEKEIVVNGITYVQKEQVREFKYKVGDKVYVNNEDSNFYAFDKNKEYTVVGVNSDEFDYELDNNGSINEEFLYQKKPEDKLVVGNIIEERNGALGIVVESRLIKEGLNSVNGKSIIMFRGSNDTDFHTVADGYLNFFLEGEVVGNIKEDY